MCNLVIEMVIGSLRLRVLGRTTLAFALCCWEPGTSDRKLLTAWQLPAIRHGRRADRHYRHRDECLLHSSAVAL